MFHASITIVRQLSGERKALPHNSCTESHMTLVARFEDGGECEAKMALRQPAGRRRYTGDADATWRHAHRGDNFRMLE